MDKECFVQKYVEQQKAYLSVYRPIDDDPRVLALQGSPTRETEFGFDTPVLRPRKPRSSPSDKDSNKENEATRKQLPGRVKRKKAPSSDVERVARLAERRERKRKKREIVKSPRRSCEDKGSKAKKKARALTPAAFALMHGFSASNVRKDRLTLQSGHLGVFIKGKASTKASVPSKKSAATAAVFSELAFLNKPSYQITTEDDVGSEQSHSCDASGQTRSKVDQAPDIRKEGGDRPLGEIQDPSEGPRSIMWDIESRNSCLADPVRSDARATASMVLDLCNSHWFAPPDPPSRRHSLPKAEGDKDDPSSSLHPSHSASQGGYRPAQPSASKYFSQAAAPSPKPSSPNEDPFEIGNDELDIDKDLPFVDAFLEVPAHSRTSVQPVDVGETCHSPAARPARPFRFRIPATQVDAASAMSLAGDTRYYQQGQPCHVSHPRFDVDICDSWVPWYEDDGDSARDVGTVAPDLDGQYDDYGDGAYDVGIGDLYGDGAYDVSIDDLYDDCGDGAYDVGIGDPYDDYGYDPGQDGSGYGFMENYDWDDEDGFQESDQGEPSFSCEDEQPLAAGLFEGRALLLGLLTSDRRQQSGLSEAEVDVAKRLDGHWWPQRL